MPPCLRSATPFARMNSQSNTQAPQRPLLSKGSPVAGGGEATTGRAAVAYQEEFNQWQVLIDAISSNLSLSPEQRTAAVINLRASQQAAAKGAQQRVTEEEKQNAKAFRRYQRRLAASLAPRYH